MQIKSDELKAAPAGVVMKYMETIMAIIYIIVGALIIWRSVELFNISNTYSLPLGSMLTVYGLFRAYRIYNKYYKKG